MVCFPAVALTEEQSIKPKRVSKHYNPVGEQAASKTTRNIFYELDTFSVRTYCCLRFEYRLALADVPVQDSVLGLEVANWLQALVDIADMGRDDLFPSDLWRKPVNKFALEQEKAHKDLERKEVERSLSFAKRRSQLKDILTQNSQKIREIKETRSAALNRSVQESKIAYLRSPEYLEQLKTKSQAIKQQKVEVKEKLETEAQKSKEASFFLKKKKVMEFTDKKAKDLSEQFNSMNQRRLEATESMAKKREGEEKKKSELQQRLLDEHYEQIQLFEIQKYTTEIAEAQLIDAMETDANWPQMERIFEEYHKRQNVWEVPESEAKVLLQKPCLKALSDSRVAPEVIALKRLVEIERKSTKLQENPAYMTLEEFQRFILMIAIDNSLHDQMLKNTEVLIELAKKRALAKDGAIKSPKRLPSKIAGSRQLGFSSAGPGLQAEAKTSSPINSLVLSPRDAGSPPEIVFDLREAEERCRKILQLFQSFDPSSRL